MTDASKPYGGAVDIDALGAAFADGSFRTAVYGLGKMGLPLAAVYADVSGNVVGADVDETVVEIINSGECHVKREPGLDELVAQTVADGALEAVTEPSVAASEADVHVVIVPTPITDEKDPDLSILDAVVDDVANGLSRGDMVIIECTVPPKTTAGRVRPALAGVSGLDPGEFGLAFCPERTKSGRAIEDITGSYPKVVGGVDEQSTSVATAIYERLTDNDVIPVADATTAEAVKIFEGLYRDVNIGLANELGALADEFGIDVTEALEVANTAPYVDLHRPGPGVGGHCIPYYPYFVIEQFDGETRMLETAREVNDEMPAFTVDKLASELGADGTPLNGADVLVLGLTYRRNVEETRKSPGIEVVELLDARGANVHAVDPVLDAEALAELPITPVDVDAVTDHTYEGVVVTTHHDEFDDIKWDNVERPAGQLVVVDGRNTLSLSDTNHRVYTIGDGS